MLSAGSYSLRPFADTDAAAFAAAVRESTATVGKWMPWAHQDYSEAEALAWFAFCTEERARNARREFGIFHSESGTLVGGCGLNHFNIENQFCNLGYWVRESWQRRGAASSAVRALVELAFGELGQGRVEIVVSIDNAPSLGVAEKMGALREGLARNRLKLRDRFTDAYVLSITPDSKVVGA